MAALLMGGGGIALAVARDTAEPGPRTGGALLINQRSITPAGTQSALGDLPVNAALSPDGAHLLVAPGLEVVRLDELGVIHHQQAELALVFQPAGV